MNKLILAAVTGALALLATPASAQHNGHGHGHSHGHVSYRHVSHHSHHSYHKPVHYAHHAHKPSYHAPHYVKPVYVATTTSYEKREAYVYQKVAGYCVDVVKSYGYNQHRKTVECKAGEYQKPAEKVAVVEQTPAPEPAPEAPQQ